MQWLPYNKRLKGLAKAMRKDSTFGEVLLWQQLRGRQFGYSFNRQKPILNYIVDFYCKALRLVIEVDGLTHQWEETIEKDVKRDKDLAALDLLVLRFEHDEIVKDMPMVVRTLEHVIEQREKYLGLEPRLGSS